MSLFKESVPDVIDLVDLQKKGILKKSAEQKEEGFVDFSKQPASPPSSFDFLNSLASASSPSSSSTKTDDAQLANLKVKLEDLEYKLDRFIERIVALEQKFNNR